MLTKSNVGGFTLVPVLFVLTLFLLLSVAAIAVILGGSSVYEKIAANMDKNYDHRVTLSYLTTKIRQNDSRGNIYVARINGAEMLAIKEVYGLDEYVTYIYYDSDPEEIGNKDGYIREIFLELDAFGRTIDFDLADGEKIIKSRGFSFDLSNGRIKMYLSDISGNTQSAQIALRSQN